MKKTGYAIKTPKGVTIEPTLSVRRSVAIEKFLADCKSSWRKCRELGYKCALVTIINIPEPNQNHPL